ncbi:MAG TPA: peptidoglycan endopeptidase [Allosphingosinicella sp.]
MPKRGEEVVARARSLIGVRYRPQGRSEETGLDCIGVVILSLGISAASVRRDYRLRGTGLPAIEAELTRRGLVCCPALDPRPGDLGLFEPGPAQVHFAIFTGTGLVHADAASRRVVERPLPAPWPALACWRPGPTQSGDR